jgi:hypothetical protein
MTQRTEGESGSPERIEADYRRMLGPKHKLDVTIRGLRRRRWTDLYHQLLTVSWGGFLLIWIVVYLTANLLFATLFWLDRGGLSGARPGSFADAFFFSVQTLGTIGYGVIAPKSPLANALVAVESFFSFGISAGDVQSLCSGDAGQRDPDADVSRRQRAAQSGAGGGGDGHARPQYDDHRGRDL